MIDTHCHIQFKGFEKNHEEVIKRSIEKNCTMFVVGTQQRTSQKAIDFAEKYDNTYAIVGLHPIHLSSTEVDEEETSFVSREETFDYELYKKMAQHPKVVAIGECGIELFHIPKGQTKQEVIELQKQGFIEQIKLASELDLPLSIHIRDAYPETLEILQEMKEEYSLKGVIHCFAGNWLDAKQFLDLGLYLGFTGIITFPPRKTNPEVQNELLEVVEKCPIDRILVETDAPYLAPQKYRGKQCEPWMIEEVIEKISRIKLVDKEKVEEILEKNTKELFNKMNA